MKTYVALKEKRGYDIWVDTGILTPTWKLVESIGFIKEKKIKEKYPEIVFLDKLYSQY
jgi:hypothetical protein